MSSSFINGNFSYLINSLSCCSIIAIAVSRSNVSKWSCRTTLFASSVSMIPSSLLLLWSKFDVFSSLAFITSALSRSTYWYLSASLSVIFCPHSCISIINIFLVNEGGSITSSTLYSDSVLIRAFLGYSIFLTSAAVSWAMLVCLNSLSLFRIVSSHTCATLTI